MIENVPGYTALLFMLTTAAALVLFFRAMKQSGSEKTRKSAAAVLSGLLLWLALQAVLALGNVYSSNTDSLPPTIFLFGILPVILAIALLFVTRKGRQFMDSLPLTDLTFLHIVRVPVEIGLFLLFLHKTIPQLMTFEGRNFDILAGITAPLVVYFGLVKGKLSRRLILAWNLICLGLLINIVVNAFFAAPSPLQKFAFDQPNIAILHFPFSWLPTFIVPVVLLAHLASIRRLVSSAAQPLL